MLEVESLAQRPQNWNGFYYVVVHGLKPGIYWSWASCFNAIGEENFHEGRGRWRKLACLQESVQLLQSASIMEEKNSKQRSGSIPQSPDLQRKIKSAKSVNNNDAHWINNSAQEIKQNAAKRVTFSEK